MQSFPSVAELQRSVKVIELQLENLQGRVASKYAPLDCNTGNFTEFQLQTGSLPFLANCTKIEPYLEGHKVTVNIGNPYTFAFSKVQGFRYYGRDLTEALKSAKEVSITETLKSGAWTTIVITVNPSKVEDMRFLLLELEAKTAGIGR